MCPVVRDLEAEMGTWGPGIRQDDVVMDVIGEFSELLKTCKSVDEATKAVKLEFAPREFKGINTVVILRIRPIYEEKNVLIPFSPPQADGEIRPC
jgi:hypothetical protein